MTKEQRDIILHSLGWDYPDQCKNGSFRNGYCTRLADPELEAMVNMGWMAHGPVINDGRDCYYFVTEAGAAAVGKQLPKD